MADSERISVLWRKSAASAGHGDCVEVAFMRESVLLRNSRDPSGPELRFSHSEWRAFLAGAKHGEFDLVEHEE